MKLGKEIHGELQQQTDNEVLFGVIGVLNLVAHRIYCEVDSRIRNLIDNQIYTQVNREIYWRIYHQTQ